MVVYEVPLDDRKRRILEKLNRNIAHYIQLPKDLSEVIYKSSKRGRTPDFTKIDENSAIVSLRDFGVLQEQVERICRSMYGILAIGMERDIYSSGHHGVSYTGFYIPDENLPATRRAIMTGGNFRKELLEDGVDLQVLEAVFKRSERLRRRFSQNYNPRFHITEILRLAGLDESERRRVRRALDKRLTGLLCRTNQIRSKNIVPHQNMPKEIKERRDRVDEEYEKNPENCPFLGPSEEEYNDGWTQPGKDIRIYIPRWFVPTARIPEIKRVLKEAR